MRICALPICLFLAQVSACGGGTTGSSGDIPATSASSELPSQLPSDDRILALLYDNSYSVPADFFIDERASTTRSYTIHHLLDTSTSYELCTDDYAVAKAWEEADNASRNVSGTYVSSYENERYYEFVRELSYEDEIGNIDALTSPGFARVFKCSNISRDGVDRSLLSGYAGTLHSYPLTDQRVRLFTEYLWQFTFFTHARKVVLDSYSDSGSGYLRHTLLLAFAINQGTGKCDRVDVAQWQFDADRDSGVVVRSYDTVYDFEATFENGAVVRCE